MPITMPGRLEEALDGANYAHLATLDGDGTPQVTAMWVMRDGDRVVVNTARGRRKWRNMRRDPRVAISLSPREEPYTNWSIQGRVVEMRTSDGDEVIDELSMKYLGTPYQWATEGMVRVTVVIEPTRIAGNR